MEPYQIVFLSVYAFFMLAMVVLKLFNVSSRKRGGVKMLLSCSFVAVAVYAAVVKGGWVILPAVALVFAALGDLFLVFEGSSVSFKRGVVSFSVAALLLSVYSVAHLGFYWWALLAFGAVEAANIFCQKKKIYVFGEMKVYLNVYTVLVGLCGMLGLSLACQGTAFLPQFLFGLGCLMYYVSDIFLGLYMFRFRNTIVDGTSTILYFSGMMLVAASLLL